VRAASLAAAAAADTGCQSANQPARPCCAMAEAVFIVACSHLHVAVLSVYDQTWSTVSPSAWITVASSLTDIRRRCELASRRGCLWYCCGAATVASVLQKRSRQLTHGSRWAGTCMLWNVDCAQPTCDMRCDCRVVPSGELALCIIVVAVYCTAAWRLSGLLQIAWLLGTHPVNCWVASQLIGVKYVDIMVLVP